ncbi:MAG TPA: hypothetical protein VHZ53_11125 [Steroidobacteraceae bacterium]|jgi:hypothetical protein|nr:hypothetical protein [Steroidobacteraceae bacterium]
MWTRITAAALLCIVVAASGCHGDSGGVSARTTHTHSAVPRKGPTAAELTSTMVDAAGVGKSQLAVELKFDLKERPVLGQPLTIDVAVLPEVYGSPASLNVTGGNGLVVPNEVSSIALPAVEAGQVYRQIVVVTPTKDGVLLLSLNVSVHHDEITESREFSIPLIVDAQSQPTAGN